MTKHYAMCSLFGLYATVISLLHGPIVANTSATRKEVKNQCVLEHLQQKYCRADFVLKMTPKNCTVVGPMCRCRIVIKSQIKVSKLFIDLKDEVIKYLNVPRDVEFIEGTKYIISGTISQLNKQQVLFTDTCDLVQQWHQLSHRHKANLRKAKFDHGCRCFNTSARSVETVTNQCLLTPGELKSDCYLKHAHCTRKTLSATAFRCQWTKSGEVKRCLREANST